MTPLWFWADLEVWAVYNSDGLFLHWVIVG
jgi:hypothetical protein